MRQPLVGLNVGPVRSSAAAGVVVSRETDGGFHASPALAGRFDALGDLGLDHVEPAWLTVRASEAAEFVTPSDLRDVTCYPLDSHVGISLDSLSEFLWFHLSASWVSPASSPQLNILILALPPTLAQLLGGSEFGFSLGVSVQWRRLCAVAAFEVVDWPSPSAVSLREGSARCSLGGASRWTEACNVLASGAAPV